MARIGEGYDNTIPDSTTQAASTWAGYVDAFVEDAIERLTSVVPASNLEFTADVDVNSQSLTGLNSVQLSQTDLTSTSTGYLYRNASNDDLYYKNGSTDIRITSGSGVNVSASGTITGGGSVNYTAIGNYFKFEDSLGGTTANVNCGDLQLDNDAETYKLSLTWNGAANQTITLPASNPAATSLVTMTSAGVMSATTSIPSFTATTATLTNPPSHSTAWTYQVPLPTGRVSAGVLYHDSATWDIAASGTGRLFIPSQVGDTVASITVKCAHLGTGGSNSTISYSGGGSSVSFASTTTSTVRTVSPAIVTAVDTGYYIEILNNNPSYVLRVTSVYVACTR